MVKALSRPPFSAMMRENAPGGVSLVPRNIRCSRKCAIPVLPSVSSAAPTLYQTICVTIGARWFGMTTTCKTVGEREAVGVEHLRRRRRRQSQEGRRQQRCSARPSSHDICPCKTSAERPAMPGVRTGSRARRSPGIRSRSTASRSIVGVPARPEVSGRVGRLAGFLEILQPRGLRARIDHLIGRAELLVLAPEQPACRRSCRCMSLAERRPRYRRAGGCPWGRIAGTGLAQKLAFAGAALVGGRRQGGRLVAGAEHGLARLIDRRHLLRALLARTRRTQGKIGRNRQRRARNHGELVGDDLFLADGAVEIVAAAERPGRDRARQWHRDADRYRTRQCSVNGPN